MKEETSSTIDLNDIQSVNIDIKDLLEVLQGEIPECTTSCNGSTLNKIRLLVDIGIEMAAEQDKLINAVFYNQQMDNAVARQSTTKTQ